MPRPPDLRRFSCAVVDTIRIPEHQIEHHRKRKGREEKREDGCPTILVALVCSGRADHLLPVRPRKRSVFLHGREADQVFLRGAS